MGRYAGETYSKKLARYELWREIIRMRRGEVNDTDYAFLASDFGGDIETLRAFGVEDTRLHAVDSDGPSLEMCRHLRAGFVDYVNDDICNWAINIGFRRNKFSYSETDPNFKTAMADSSNRSLATFLDLCAPLSGATLRLVGEVARTLRQAGDLFAVNLLKGRENPRENRVSNIYPSSVGSPTGGHERLMSEPRHVWRKWLEQILAGDDSDVHGLLWTMSRLYKNTHPLVPRICLLTESLRLTTHVSWFPTLAIEYKGNASPMLTLAFANSGAKLSYWSIGQFEILNGPSLDAMRLATIPAGSRQFYRGYSHVNQKDVDSVVFSGRAEDDNPSIYDRLIQVPSLRFYEKEAKKTVIDSCTSSIGSHNSKFLAVNARQVAAWKAVRTRRSRYPAETESA